MNINFKNIIFAIAGGALGIVLFVSVSQRVEGLDTVFRIPLTTKGGTMNIEQFQLARKSKDREGILTHPNSVLQPDNENAIFRMVGTSIMDSFLSFGQTRFEKLAIGYNDRNVGEAKLSVNGAITIKGLAHDGLTEVKACVNDFGVIKPCGGDVNHILPSDKGGHTWFCVKDSWSGTLSPNTISSLAADCSHIDYASDLIYPDGGSACVKLGTFPSDSNCGVNGGNGGGTGGGGTISNGTKYDCAQDGMWHKILVTCSPAISSSDEFYHFYGVQCADQSATFSNVCFTSNPTNDCIGSNDPPCGSSL